MTYVVELDTRICALGDSVGNLARELCLLLDLRHRLVDLVDRPVTLHSAVVCSPSASRVVI